MENNELREECNKVIEKYKNDLFNNKKCIAAYLLGSFSHDKIWKWSDIQIEVICDDGYKGNKNYTLYEDEMYVSLNIHTLTEFKNFIGKFNVDDHMWKAFSKGKVLFSKDIMLDELFEEAYYIGDVDKQKEMLLGFSNVVYYLNKAEKNFYIKENIENVVYFIPQIVEGIAWLEVTKHKEIPEREITPQGKRLNPEFFAKVYDPFIEKRVDKSVIKDILDSCVMYLEENTKMVYLPIIEYLEKNGNLEYFKYETRPHGFGINYEWLVRCGIAERYGIPEKNPILNDTAYRLGYRLKR